MKKCFAWLMLLALLLTLGTAGAEETSAALTGTAGTKEISATLTVTGSATVTLEADYARLTLGVITSDVTVDAASTLNADKIAAVVAALKAAGVAEADIVTEDYTVNPVYDYSYGKIGDSQTVSGYQVEQLLRVTVRALDQVGALLDTGMKAGANETYGITFLSTKSGEAQDEALAAAVREAGRRAAVMAEACGKQVTALTALAESGSGAVGVTVMYDAAVKNAGAGTTILPDTLTVTASVTATYAMK